MKDFPEKHMQGKLSIENKEMIEEMLKDLKPVDFGIQISADGRVWICINGAAFLRFKPLINQFQP